MCFKQIGFGPYSATLGGLRLGLTEGVYEIRQTAEIEPIVADQFGRTMIDGIYMGGNVAIAVSFKEWNQAVLSAAWPFDDAHRPGFSGTIGRCINDPTLAKELILTPIAGPNVSLGGTITVPLAIIMPGHTFNMAFGNAERIVNVAFQAMPQLESPGSGTNNLYWYTIEQLGDPQAEPL